jgi:class 3 adenylate cyclase
LELDWEIPALARFIERLASFCRLIRFDNRGSGVSDRVVASAIPSLDQRMDDLKAVMDAAGSQRASLFGVSEGGPMCILFAASHPERTESMILYGAHAVANLAGDIGLRGALARDPEAFIRAAEEGWGEGFGLEYMAPSIAGIPAAREVWARFQRSAASPAAAAAVLRMSLDSNVSEVLPAIQVPTLVLHRAGDQAVGVVHGRYLAERIRGARYIELAGDDHFYHMGDSEAILAAIEEFVTGTPAAAPTDRVLATVMFTDIVGSTERAVELGDRRWKDVLGDHTDLVRRQLERYRGHEVKTTGDGFLATFDSPARGVSCAAAIRDGVRAFGIDIRAGVHVGEIEIQSNDIGGIAVHVAARIQAVARPGRVLVSQTIVDLVAGSGLAFEDQGEHELKGVPGSRRLFAVRG